MEHGGLDEISLAGETQVAEVNDGAVRRFTLSPADFGLAQVPLKALRGGTPQENAADDSRAVRRRKWRTAKCRAHECRRCFCGNRNGQKFSRRGPVGGPGTLVECGTRKTRAIAKFHERLTALWQLLRTSKVKATIKERFLASLGMTRKAFSSKPNIAEAYGFAGLMGSCLGRSASWMPHATPPIPAPTKK